MYSLDCSYYTAEFKTLDELIEAATINGMDPNYEITFTHLYMSFQKYIQNREHNVNIT
jgi:hypothetical protein